MRPISSRALCTGCSPSTGTPEASFGTAARGEGMSAKTSLRPAASALLRDLAEDHDLERFAENESRRDTHATEPGPDFISDLVP